MRIVAGAFRGRPLAAPKGPVTRPTADRTRQALFDVLEHAAWSSGLEGRRVLDLFAGSGALGLEALSRGAVFCLFAERAATARAAIQRNITALGVGAQTRIEPVDATRLARRGPSAGSTFEVVFLDPPYGEGLVEAALAALKAGDWLAAGAIVAVETGASEPAVRTPGFERLDERSWGAARVSFLRAAP